MVDSEGAVEMRLSGSGQFDCPSGLSRHPAWPRARRFFFVHVAFSFASRGGSGLLSSLVETQDVELLCRRGIDGLDKDELGFAGCVVCFFAG